MTCVILCIVYVLFSFSSVFIVIDSVNSLEMHSKYFMNIHVQVKWIILSFCCHMMKHRQIHSAILLFPEPRNEKTCFFI